MLNSTNFRVVNFGICVSSSLFQRMEIGVNISTFQDVQKILEFQLFSSFDPNRIDFIRFYTHWNTISTKNIVPMTK